jgi:hypothetical protein
MDWEKIQSWITYVSVLISIIGLSLMLVLWMIE